MSSHIVNALTQNKRQTSHRVCNGARHDISNTHSSTFLKTNLGHLDSPASSTFEQGALLRLAKKPGCGHLAKMIAIDIDQLTNSLSGIMYNHSQPDHIHV